MRVVFPFTAIVDQERMKRALVLCAIHPQIGGVLIRGERGTAKSTTWPSSRTPRGSGRSGSLTSGSFRRRSPPPGSGSPMWCTPRGICC
jgi:hypothetical protein